MYEVQFRPAWPDAGGPDLTYVIGRLEAPQYERLFVGPRTLAQAVTDGWVNNGADDFARSVLDQNANVIRLNDTDGSLYDIKQSLTAADWQNIFDYGGSFGGTCSLALGPPGDNGFAALLQCNSGEIPASAGAPYVGTNRRYALLIDRNSTSGNLNFRGFDGATIDLDTGIPADEWVEYQLLIPAGFGTARLRYRRFGTNFFWTAATQLPFNTNSGGLGTYVGISSGSSGGIDRVSYHFAFGVGIPTSSAVLTLTDAHFNGVDETQILTPVGARDIEVQVDPGVRGVPKGHKLTLALLNYGGSVRFRDLNTPPIFTINGLSDFTIPVNSPVEALARNRVGGSQDYLIDLDGGRDMTRGRLFQLGTDGNFADTTVTLRSFSYTNVDLLGMATDPGKTLFTVEIRGKYRPRFFMVDESRDEDMGFQLQVNDVLVEEVVALVHAVGVVSDFYAEFAVLDLAVGDTVKLMARTFAGTTTIDFQNAPGVCSYFELEQCR